MGEWREHKGWRAIRAALLGSALGAAVACVEPSDQRPGLYISGESADRSVSDWSFTDSIREIYVETRAWYLLPHSVTVHVAQAGGSLYVGSIYGEGGEFPDARPWNRNAVRNPNVRLGMDGVIYRLRAVPVEDAAESDAAFAAIAAKYEQPWGALYALPASERPPVHFFRMEPREG